MFPLIQKLLREMFLRLLPRLIGFIIGVPIDQRLLKLSTLLEYVQCLIEQFDLICSYLCSLQLLCSLGDSIEICNNMSSCVPWFILFLLDLIDVNGIHFAYSAL